MKKLLLHICCGPCSIYPLEILQANFEVTAFYYNPNIQPKDEYSKRLAALKKYLAKHNVELIEAEYNPQEHLEAVKGFENIPQKRCPLCWKLRLDKTAQFAAENKYDSFTSTLLVSPHQDINKIKELGKQAGTKNNIEFFDNSDIKTNKKYKGFRAGFTSGRQTAKHEGMYCQDYCGCLFSKLEKEEQI